MSGPAAPPGPSARVRVQVRALASSGAGVADLPDGRVVFVHGTVPGDDAEVRVERQKARWATARLERVVEAGAARVEAPCPHFGECGGCTLQHVAYDQQLLWKGRFVADALARIGGLEAPPPEVVPSPAPFRYRNRLTFTLRRLRGGRVVAGFHALERPGHVIDVHGACLLPHAPILRVWKGLRRAWGPAARQLPAAGRLRLALHDGEVEGGGVMLLVEGGAAGWRADELLDAVDGLASVWHRADPDQGLVRAAGAEGAPPTFRQVNDAAAALLRAHVLEVAGAPARVVDAYCGDGAYARPLALVGSRVTGIEMEPRACARARDGAPEGLTVVEGRVEDHLRAALPADLVLVNPPRAGLDASVVALLAEHRPPRVVYVSCDPATLARDLQRLGSGFTLAGVRAFDLFPQTAHVETVAVLDAREGG